MDSIVKVRRSFMNEIRAFCNMFAQMCDGCCRRPCDCFMSDYIHRARNLIIAIDHIRNAEEERYYIENPAEETYAKIMKAMRQAGGKNVRASSIRIQGVYKQQKSRAIKKLLKRGKIEMTIVGGERLYSVCEDGNNTNNTKQHNKGERYGV